MAEGKFVLKKITRSEDITENTVLPESDLCLQDNGMIYQFKFEQKEDKDKEKLIIKPGYYTFAVKGQKISLIPIELRKRDLLTTVVNTQTIYKEAQTFFNRLHIYDMLGEQKVRKMLLYSQPGMGKSSTITSYCEMALKEDPGTVAIVWPTATIEPDWVSSTLENMVKYTKKCTRVIFIMEDIGGGESENHGGARRVDSALLDLLDGLRQVFKLPTFIIATTNYPQNLLSALADRPGRFDMMYELDPPSQDEKIALVEWISKRSLTDEEKEVFRRKDIADFSVAHLKEVVVRSMLHDKTLKQVVTELVNHKKRFHNSFENNKERMGFGDE